SPAFLFPPTATTEIYTLSLHDALPISASIQADARASIYGCSRPPPGCRSSELTSCSPRSVSQTPAIAASRNSHSECGSGSGWREIGRATSELQSRGHLVCRLLLEKKNP